MTPRHAARTGGPSRGLRAGLVLSLVVGLALMLPFESALTRVLGMTALAAFIVLGVFTIAEPGFLSGDRDDPEDREPVPGGGG